MKRKTIGLLMIFLFLASGCALFQTVKERPFTTWSSKKQLTFAIKIYNSEYDKYVAAAARPDLSASQVEYLKNKRDALIALDSIIQTLIPIADAGGDIPPGLESQLLLLLNGLGIYPM